MTDDTALRMVAEEQVAELGSRVDVLTSKIDNLEGRVNHHRELTQTYRVALEEVVEHSPQCGWGGCKASRITPMCARCIAQGALGESPKQETHRRMVRSGPVSEMSITPVNDDE